MIRSRNTSTTHPSQSAQASSKVGPKKSSRKRVTSGKIGKKSSSRKNKGLLGFGSVVGIVAILLLLFVASVRNKGGNIGLEEINHKIISYKNGDQAVVQPGVRGGSGSGSGSSGAMAANKAENGNAPHPGTKSFMIQTASSSDEIVESLLELAHMPVKQLQSLLEGRDSQTESNPFGLHLLQEGNCPWDNNNISNTNGEVVKLPWLPDKNPSQPSEWFKNYELDQKQSEKDRPIVAVYYEHLSKAGGTSFCKLAQSNMHKKLVPNYYCMPSKPNMIDARIGSWPNDEVRTYFETNSHRLASNEWEPFQLDLLDEFQMTGTSGASDADKKVILLFVTSIRHPINRLLSAHKFWGILNGPKINKPSLELWLTRYARRAKQWYTLSEDFNGNVGRFNFATWKFSGGAIPVPDLALEFEQIINRVNNNDDGNDVTVNDKLPTPQQWKQPFETAIRTLARFDLVIPMEELSNNSQPVTDILGWKNFAKAHVVNMGKVVNNNASDELPTKEYDLLWQANALDMILYYWTKAVYLTRVHCSEHLTS